MCIVAQAAVGTAAETARSPNLVGLAVISVAALATVGVAAKQQGTIAGVPQSASPTVGASSSNGASASGGSKSPPDSGKSPQAAEARAWIEAWRGKQK